jgi:divalent metal cation (Fe/Co/Zn/Cd) transporter
MADPGLQRSLRATFLCMVVIADAPADADHPYGHGKAEPLASALVATMLLLAALWIAVNSVRETFGELMDTAPDLAVVEQLRRIAASVPEVRGVEKCHIRKQARRLGAADFLEKPLNMDKLVARILGHLKLGRSRQPKLPTASKRKES